MDLDSGQQISNISAFLPNGERCFPNKKLAQTHEIIFTKSLRRLFAERYFFT